MSKCSQTPCLSIAQDWKVYKLCHLIWLVLCQHASWNLLLWLNIEVNTMNQQAMLNQITWQQVLTIVGTEYQTLLGNGQWKAKIMKPQTSVMALKAEIKKEVLSELKKADVKQGGGTQVQPAATNEGKKNPNIECYDCKEKGHIAMNCPKKSTTATSGGGGRKDKNPTSNPYKIKPKDGESKVKVVNNEQCTWCDRCQCWTAGDK